MKYIKLFIISIIVVILIIISVIVYINKQRSINNYKQQNMNNDNYQDEDIQSVENNISEDDIELNDEMDENKDSIENEVNSEDISEVEYAPPLEEDSLSTEDLIGTDITYLTDSSIFATIRKCVQTYIDYGVDKQYYNIYALLDYDYIKANNITEENVEETVSTFSEYQNISIRKICMQNIDINKSRYYVYLKTRKQTTIRENEKVTESDYYITVIINKANNKYTIYPDQQYTYSKISQIK